MMTRVMLAFMVLMAFGCSERGQVNVVARNDGLAVDNSRAPANQESSCVCDECPEQIECSECPICQVCPAVLQNPFTGEYSAHSLVFLDPVGGYIIYPHTWGDCYARPEGNVSFEEGNDYERRISAQINVAIECDGESDRVFGFLSISGTYTFDRRNIFIINEDETVLRFRYEIYEDGREYFVELTYPRAEYSEEMVLEFVGLERASR